MLIESLAGGSSLLSFLGGSVFRMLWGEVSAYLQKRQDHTYELERIKLQETVDAQTHQRNLEAVRVKSELGIKEIEVQGSLNLQALDAEIFRDAVQGVDKISGIGWVDAWNKSIRPALATQMMLLITLYYANSGWKLDERGWDLAAAVLGVFVADRSLFKRGK